MMLHYRKITQYFVIVSLGLLVPAVAFAAPANMREFAALVVKILQSVTGVIFASLAVGLLYGVVLFLANSDNEQKRENIKSYLLWGVIGIIVVMGIWGILGLLRQSVFQESGVGIPKISAPS